jgi:hypothetical protein
MNSATTSLDQLLHSPDFPMWLPFAAAGLFGFILLVTLFRAQKSVANGALAVITLLSIGVAVAATMREVSPDGHGAPAEIRPPPQRSAALPALSCIDDMAGETVLAACEKTLFGSADSTAAAVSYAASQIARLTAYGDAVVLNKSLTYELLTLRRAIERDRYGLMAYVLMTRDQCTAAQCAAFRSLTDSRQIVVNMTGRTYDGLVTRYAPSWNAPPAAPPAPALVSSAPAGKPTNAEFPTAASTPAVSIMTPEPGSATAPTPPRAAASAPAASAAAASAPAAAPAASASAPVSAPASAANAALLSPRPTSSAAPAALAAAKKQPAPKPSRASAPVQLAPATPAEPATAND